jgi:hypothetical protein
MIPERQACAAGFNVSLKERVNKRRDRRTRCKDYEAAEQDQAEDDRQEPELFPLLHERPKLQQKFSHWTPPLNNLAEERLEKIAGALDKAHTKSLPAKGPGV